MIPNFRHCVEARHDVGMTDIVRTRSGISGSLMTLPRVYGVRATDPRRSGSVGKAKWPIDSQGKHDLSRPMQTADAERMVPHDFAPLARSRASRERSLGRWLISRLGTSWFYAMADTIHFGAQAGADAFRRWMMARVD